MKAGELRPEVLWFASQMEARLRANDHKGGWGSLDCEEAEERLLEEFAELDQVLTSRPDPATDQAMSERDVSIVREAADVANFCMFIADNQRKSAEGLSRGWES